MRFGETHCLSCGEDEEQHSVCLVFCHRLSCGDGDGDGRNGGGGEEGKEKKGKKGKKGKRKKEKQKTKKQKTKKQQSTVVDIDRMRKRDGIKKEEIAQATSPPQKEKKNE